MTSPRREKRKSRRTAIFLPAVIDADDVRYECKVLNISSGGALVLVEGSFSPAGAFNIRIHGSDPIRASLERRANGKIGISFLEEPAIVESMIEELLAKRDIHHDLRRHPRRFVLLTGGFYHGDRHVRCDVRNISLGGVFVATDDPLPTGTDFELTINRFGLVPVRAVRADPAGMGCIFLSKQDEIVERFGHLLP